MNGVEHFWSISFYLKNNLLSSLICKGNSFCIVHIVIFFLFTIVLREFFLNSGVETSKEGKHPPLVPNSDSVSHPPHVHAKKKKKLKKKKEVATVLSNIYSRVKCLYIFLKKKWCEIYFIYAHNLCT